MGNQKVEKKGLYSNSNQLIDRGGGKKSLHIFWEHGGRGGEKRGGMGEGRKGVIRRKSPVLRWGHIRKKEKNGRSQQGTLGWVGGRLGAAGRNKKQKGALPSGG